MADKVETLAQKITEKILSFLDLSCETKKEVIKDDKGDKIIKIQIETSEPGFIIGYHGQTLKDLEFLVNLIVYKQTGDWNKIVLNVGEYREKREEFLKSLAQKTAERAKSLKEPIALSPMSGSERRIIHLYLKDNPDVTTESVGEGGRRKVIVKPS